MKSKSLVTTLVLSALCSSIAHADQDRQDRPTSQWGIGIGAIAQDQGYVDISTETNVIPVIYYQSENFQLLGPNFSYQLYQQDDFSFELAGQYRFDGFKPEDGDIFAGMEERKGTFDLGFGFDYESDFGDFSVKLLADAGGEHKGNEISIGYSKDFRFERAVLTPYVNATRMNADLIDYYYGVRTSEVTDSRHFYQGESTTNFEFGARYQWQYDQNHSILFDAAYTAYGSAIKDSPLVDGSGSLRVILGYVYVF